MANNPNQRRNAAMRQDTIDLVMLAKALWHRAWLIVLAAVVFAVAFFAYAKFMITPMYSSRVLMYVNNTSIGMGTKESVTTGEITAAKSLVDTYLIILNSRNTIEEVIEQSGLNYSYGQVASMVSASAVNETEIFQIRVTCPNPEDAETLVNTFARVLPYTISTIVDGSSVRVVENGVVNYGKVSPNTKKYAMEGFMLGFILACGIIVVIELMDDKIKDTDYLLQNYDVPLLATIPDLLDRSNNGYAYYSYRRKE